MDSDLHVQIDIAAAVPVHRQVCSSIQRLKHRVLLSTPGWKPQVCPFLASLL